MPLAIVTGANSGIGHALAKRLIDEGFEVVACDIEITGDISQLGGKVVRLDVGNPDSIDSLKQDLGNSAVEVLFNVAGVLVPGERDKLGNVDLDCLQKTFTTNTYGPLLLSQALLPNILKAANPRIYNVSSRVGSISDNSSGGAYAYRASKAALNSISKSMAVDLKSQGVTVLILHPGIVKTKLVPDSSSVAGAVEPAFAAEGLWKVCKSKTIEHSGTFWHRDGYELPW